MKIETTKIIPEKSYDTKITYSGELIVKSEDESEPMLWHDAMAKFDNNPESEWRLPTRHELLIMYDNRGDIGEFDDDWYWSSSKYNTDTAWMQHFSDGTPVSHLKNFLHLIRLVNKGGIE